MKTKLLQLAKMGASIVFFMMLTSALAQESFPQLIEFETSVGSGIEADLHFYGQKQAILRYSEVKLNDLITLPNAFNIDDKIELNLFDNSTYLAKVRSSEENVMGTVVITADLIEYSYAYAIIATTGERSLINVYIPEANKHFQIISDPVTLKHYLIEINPSLMPVPVEYPSLIPGELTAEDIKEQQRIANEIGFAKSGPGDPATIDVMIVYTPAARNWGNTNGGGIFNCVATAVAIGNTAHANSATILTIRLVHTAEITYTESGDVELDLDRLTLTADGHMDIVHTWRNTYGADLVQLFSTMGGGIGWLLNSTSGKPADAFSIAGVSTATAYTPIHEMGHNMGCGHHKQQNFQAGPGLYTYAAGWRWQGTDDVWYSSVMSYTGAGYFPSNPVNSTRVGHFSNPSVNFMGVATGDATDGDNARAIRNTKHVIAAYRSTATINCITCPGYDFTSTPGNSWATHSSSFAASGCKMYRISVEQGRTYTFKTGCGNGATANFDTYLHVYDNNCEQVAFNDQGCEENRSIVSWMATYTGYAYVKVRGWSGAGGTYTMAYQRTDELTWQGDVSTNWNTAGNWDGNVVPDNSFNVVIPAGTTYNPNIYLANAECKSLTVESGAILNMGAYNLVVSEDVNIHGTLNQNSNSSKLYVYGNIFWQSGSAATATGSATIYVKGIWEFMNGANVYLTGGYVDFFGSGVSYIRSKDADSHFNHIRNNKTGTILGHSGVSTYPCRLNGNLYIYSNCEFRSYTAQNFHIGNFVNNMNGVIVLDVGTFVFDGASGTSFFMPGDYFNNVTISSSGTTTFDDDIEIRGNLLIESGALSVGSTSLSIKGNWTNSVGPSGFVEGTGTVVFNGGNYHQICSTETFNILEVNKTAGGAFRVSSGTVACNQYNWTAGAVDVITGTFTALDLADNGLDGGYWVNPGATINLYQDALQYVDLRCHLNFNGGGTINVYGGNGYSFWPFGYNASITMSGGVLDFKDNGILIHNTGSLTLDDNITGGTIRMSRGFQGERADFTPFAGTFEFYGSGDYLISQANGCTLPNVEINKSAKEGGEDNINGPVYDERSGHLLTDGGKANTITLGSNFVITGDLTVNAGSFNLSTSTCDVEGKSTIFGQLIMTNAANDFTTVNMYWENGSSANVTAGTFHAGSWAFREGTTAKFGTGNTTYITSSMSFPTSNEAEFGNLVRGPLSKNVVGEDNSKTYYPVKVMGNLLIKSGADLFYQQSGSHLIVAGNAVIESGSFISFSDADFQVGGTLNLSGNLSVISGRLATVQGEFTFPSTGLLNLNQGTFTNNYSTGIASLGGTLQFIDGVAEFPNRSVSIFSTFNDQISGGVFRVGKTLSANTAGTFQPLAGTVEFVNTSVGNYVQVTNGNYLHNMVLDKPGSSFQVYDNLTIKGSLFIDAGVLNSNNKTISIAENWYNNVGTSAFNETNSRVIFNGTIAQFCSTEDFYILEVNKPLQLLYNLAEHNITCQIYDWTSGGIWISPGNFTANDLADDGLRGTFAIFGGTMNLHQDNGQFIDFAGDINIGTDGILNVYGGSMRSYWPYFSNASLTMSGGAILDIKDQGIWVYNTPTWTFTANITGGTIRTARGFESERSDFTPTAGLFEFYGTLDAHLYQTNGSTLFNVLINKSSKENTGNESGNPEYDLRSGKLISDGSKDNTISILTNFNITNNLTLSTGSLTLNNNTLTVNRNCFIQGTLNMTQVADVLNVGTYWHDWLEFQSGSTANVTNGTINCYGWIIPRAGCTFNLGMNNTVFIKGESLGGLSNFEPSATYGNVVIAKNAGNYAYIDGIATQPIIVNGNFTMSADNTFWTQSNRMTVHGICTDLASSTIAVLNEAKKDGFITSSSKEPVNFEPPKIDYYLEIDTDFTLNGALFINNSGKVLIHGEFASAAGSSITINNGSFIADSPNHSDKGWEYLSGNLTMSSGLFEITNNSAQFSSTATTNISGGVIRSGGAFYAANPGVFQPTGGVVEITGSNPDASIYCFNGNHFYNLLINRGSDYSLFQWGDPVLINNNLTIQSGELRTGSSQVSVAGNVEVNDGGKLSVTGPGSLLMGASRSITINNNGVLELTGSLAYQPKISIISTGNYALNIESGATMGAEYAIFEYMNTNGVNIKPGAIVDPAMSFANCNFRNGQSGGKLLTINNNQSLLLNNVLFPGSSGNFNVSKTVDAGVVVLSDYSGVFAGPANEQDTYGRIHWNGELSTTVDLDGILIGSGQDLCFEALQTITVGGSQSFVVENGGNVNLVAGQNIRLLEGTHVHSGAYLHAWITTDGIYCGSGSSMLAVIEENNLLGSDLEETNGQFAFRVFPNPTTGIFTLELLDFETSSSMLCEIYDMMGKRVWYNQLPANTNYLFDLTEQQPGIYFIRIMLGSEAEVTKLVKK